jgi:putative peptidoglycan lipid II flippase
MTFGVGVYYVDLVLSRRFLSELGPGAQSYFTWAQRLCDFPQGIFVMALSTAALPSLSTFAAKAEWSELAKTYAHGMRLALFVAVPASVGLVALAEPIVTTLFVRGQFDAQAAHETARALVFQGGAIWTVAAVRQLIPVFYALGDTRTPVAVSVVDLLAFVGIALALRGPWGQAGISAAVAGSSFVQMALLVLALTRRLRHVHATEILASASRTLVASLAGAAAGVTAASAIEHGALAGIIGALVFGTVFLAAAWLLRSRELAALGGALARGRHGGRRGGVRP